MAAIKLYGTLIRDNANDKIVKGSQVDGGYFVCEALPTWGTKGQLCYNTADSKFYQYNGTEWKEAPLGSDKVSKVTAPEIVYGTDASGSQTSYSKDSFGKVDDVKVKLTAESSYISVVGSDKVANVDLSSKQDILTAGSNISISNNTISATDTTYTAGNGIVLAETQFSADTDVLATKEYVDGKVSNEATQRQNADTNLQLQITELKAKGRFLSVWNCRTGKPETSPATLPYDYKSGDYYIIGVVSQESGDVNYRPNGKQYTGVASTVVELQEVKANDYYVYDGPESNTWTLISATVRTYTFSEIAGNARDNINLKTELEKVDAHIANKTNPHEVTKAQVGLGNVDNTSDINKPVSTAQATAIADAKAEAIQYADSNFIVKDASGNLKIGNTTLSEQQLIKLIALLDTMEVE